MIKYFLKFIKIYFMGVHQMIVRFVRFIKSVWAFHNFEKKKLFEILLSLRVGLWHIFERFYFGF
jgi:hypothetical protein